MRINVKFKEIDVDAITNAIEAEMRRELDIQRRMLERAYKGWDERHKPLWELETDLKGNNKRVAYTTESTPFVWVMNGHSGGYVKFSRDYRPRTRKGVLGSRKKQGMVLFRGKSQGAPKKKPVEGREWHLEAAKRRRSQYNKNMSKAVIRGINKAKRGKKIGEVSGVI